MTSKTKKRFNYKKVFEKIEQSVFELIDEGSDKKKNAEYRTNLKKFKRRLNPNDQECFERLIMTAFYSGFKADTVDKYRDSIKAHFPSWRIVSGYTKRDIKNIMSDPEMIKNSKKINACVKNAEEFKQIVEKHGSFRKYVELFKVEDSFDNLICLKKNLESRFSYVSKVNVYHFMKDIGIPVLKPDRVIMRIFERLGLVYEDTQLISAIEHGIKFAEATQLPIRYIDKIFVAFGQVARNDLGIEKGICLSKERRRCEKCRAIFYCKFYKKYGMPSSAV